MTTETIHQMAIREGVDQIEVMLIVDEFAELLSRHDIEQSTATMILRVVTLEVNHKLLAQRLREKAKGGTQA